ncbi:MAG TPA: hypothetical protein PLM07_14610, partial [Candidatus Rifleibacterium sp.]|nr:hypothetical protein [Candidatus Rifleibacterium sp.]
HRKILITTPARRKQFSAISKSSAGHAFKISKSSQVNRSNDLPPLFSSYIIRADISNAWPGKNSS